MNTKRCSKCGELAGPMAVVCPHCRQVLKTTERRHQLAQPVPLSDAKYPGSPDVKGGKGRIIFLFSLFAAVLITLVVLFFVYDGWDDLVLYGQKAVMRLHPLYYQIQEKTGIDILDQDIRDIDLELDCVSVSFDTYDTLSPDPCFVMENGSRISLPMSYGEFLDTGWSRKYGKDSPYLAAGDFDWIDCVDSRGKTIGILIHNESSAPVQIRDAIMNQLTLEGENAATFTLNNVTSESTALETVQQWGLPDYITLTRQLDGSDYFAMHYECQDYSDGRVYVCFDWDTQLTSRIDFYTG